MTNIRNHPVDELELMAYLDGELSRERATAAAVHLERCAACKVLADDLRGISQELAGWQIKSSATEITPAISTTLEKHIRSRENSAGKDRHLLWHGWLGRRILIGGLATGVLAVFLIALSVPNLMRSPQKAMMAESAQSRAVRETPRSRSESTAQPAPAPTPSYVTMEQLELSSVGTDKLQKEQLRAGVTSANGNLSVSPGPMVIRTAELFLTSTEFDQSRNRVEEILKRHKGYLGDLNVSETTSSARMLTATLRVPSDQLDSAIAELKKLGRVESESQKGEEVSQQYIDLQARLLNARNSEQRLTELLRRAGKLSDVLAVEEQIESVRENIERMDAERKNLARQVAFSTVSMKITEDYKEHVHVVPDSTWTRLRNAAVEGYEMMVAGLINLLLFLVSWGPSLLLWGLVLFFPVRWLWRKRERDLF